MRLKMAMQANTFVDCQDGGNGGDTDDDVHKKTIKIDDYRIVDLFCSDLIVDRVEVDVGEEGGEGDQQGHLKRNSQTKTFTFPSRERNTIRDKTFYLDFDPKKRNRFINFRFHTQKSLGFYLPLCM